MQHLIETNVMRIDIRPIYFSKELLKHLYSIKLYSIRI